MTLDLSRIAEFGQGAGLAPGADIEALAFLVLLKAAEASEADLKTVMDEVAGRNESLCLWRKLIADLEVHRDNAANIDLVRSTGAVIADRLSGLIETTEQTMQRLQTAMDRRSKFIEAVSNILKKQSETASALLGNLK